MNNYSGRVAIVGVTGYSGQELDRLLAVHPQIRVAGRFASKTDEASGVEAFSVEKLRKQSPDVVVLATEHEFSLHLVPELLDSGYRVVDMSGAFRLKDAALYPQWYGFEHTAPKLLEETAYGIPEFYAERIQGCAAGCESRMLCDGGHSAAAAVVRFQSN